MSNISKTEEDIQKFANDLHFKEQNDKLVGKFNFKEFDEVKVFVNKVMSVADELNHHPEVTFSYNWVKISTTTHDAGNKVTEKDFKLAKSIDDIYLS